MAGSRTWGQYPPPPPFRRQSMTKEKWKKYLEGFPHGGPLTEKEWGTRFIALNGR